MVFLFLLKADDAVYSENVKSPSNLCKKQSSVVVLALLQGPFVNSPGILKQMLQNYSALHFTTKLKRVFEDK